MKTSKIFWNSFYFAAVAIFIGMFMLEVISSHGDEVITTSFRSVPAFLSLLSINLLIGLVAGQLIAALIVSLCYMGKYTGKFILACIAIIGMVIGLAPPDRNGG